MNIGKHQAQRRARLGQSGLANLMQRTREALAAAPGPLGHEELASGLAGGFTLAQVRTAVANLRRANDVVASGSPFDLKFELTDGGRAKVPARP